MASRSSRQGDVTTTSPAGPRSAAASAAAILLASILVACGIAPVTTTPTPPPTVGYLNPHGRPRAFGGGVCPIQGRHEHVYPPVPKAFFVDVGGAWRDVRAITSFTGPHRWRGGICQTSRFHQHAVAPGDLAAAPPS